ncbi:amidohydrolase family protein [Streptomonospora arabica]|uniref:Amidohydrolase family protein n=1 Tax=Streptomonospora arabica TaxID=412417 RepID=A0ABV9SQD0_9ACTN
MTDRRAPTPVVDFHVRLAPVAGAAERLLRRMDALAIERAVVCAGGVLPLFDLSRQLVEGGRTTGDPDNGAVLAAAERSGGRLVPAYFGNPHRDADAYRDAAPHYRGLEVSPAVHGVALTDDRLAGLLDAAETAGHSVYTVCLEREGCRVADLARLAAARPEVTFVLGHTGVGNIDLYGISLVAPLPNVLVETSGGYTCAVAEAVAVLGGERVLFGSEYPLQDPAVELAKLDALDLAPADRRRVTRDNALRLLGAAREEAAR